MLLKCVLLNRRNQLCFLMSLAAVLSASCQKQPQADKAVEPSPSVQAAAVQKNPVEQLPPVVVGKPYPGVGVVTIINVKEGWVELDHEPIEGLMPAMQMEWWVKDRSLLKNVQVGDKVEFVVVESGKGEYITEMKKIKAESQ